MATLRIRRVPDLLADRVTTCVQRRGGRYVIELHADEAARMGLLDGKQVQLEFIAAAGWTQRGDAAR